LSATNRLTPDTYDITGDTDAKSRKLWLVQYCQSHPLSKLVDGVEAFIDERYPLRQKTGK
jgi:hypothetical protein